MAGIFSLFGDINKEKENISCIICVNSKEFNDIFKALYSKKDKFYPQFLKLTIPKLWRLEAQKGVFLYCPTDQLEAIFSFDRILFPNDGTFFKSKYEKEIIPERKNDLENQIDKFFSTEDLIRGSRRLKKFIRENNVPHVIFEKEDLVQPNTLSGKNGWNIQNISPWVNPLPEKYDDVKSVVKVKLSLNDKELSKTNLKIIIADKIQNIRKAKKSLIHWEINLGSRNLDQENLQLELSEMLNKFWDGIRLYPYRKNDIISGMVNLILLRTIFFKDYIDMPNGFQRVCEDYFSNAVELEFGVEFRIYSRGFAKKSSLINAINPNLFEETKNINIDNIDNKIYELLPKFSKFPGGLFDFQKLTSIFIQQIIPTEIVTERNAIYFSLGELDIFGLA